MEEKMLKNSDGNKSLTTTLLIVGAIVMNAKLILSQVTLWGMTFEHFTASDYGIGLTALSGLYLGRRFTMNQENKDEKES